MGSVKCSKTSNEQLKFHHVPPEDVDVEPQLLLVGSIRELICDLRKRLCTIFTEHGHHHVQDDFCLEKMVMFKSASHDTYAELDLFLLLATLPWFDLWLCTQWTHSLCLRLFLNGSLKKHVMVKKIDLLFKKIEATWFLWETLNFPKHFVNAKQPVGQMLKISKRCNRSRN